MKLSNSNPTRIHIKVATSRISLLLKLMLCEVPLCTPLTEQTTQKDLLILIYSKQGISKSGDQPQIYTTKTATIIRTRKAVEIVTKVRIDTRSIMVWTLTISGRSDLALVLIAKTTQVKLQSQRKRSKTKVSQRWKRSIANQSY